jgi:squalene-hopene/tetraprenyl-beta-curcumene cyclase
LPCAAARPSRDTSRRWCLAAVVVAAACAAPTAPTAPRDRAAATPSWRASAIAYLDARAVHDTDHPPHVEEIPQNVACTLTCHTTHPYLLARPSLAGDPAALDHVRAAVEARVDAIADWSTAQPLFGKPGDELARRSIGTEAVLNASALVLDDVARGRPPTPAAKRAVELMWRAQRDDGAWDWFDFELVPFEVGDDFGAALAARLAADLPDADPARLAKLVAFLDARAPEMALHDKAYLAWAASRWSALRDKLWRDRLASEVQARQRPDGGWSLATWGRGERADADGASDGYATGLALLALCHDVDRRDVGRLDRIARGRAWLVRAQQANGAWPARSVNVDANAEPNRTYAIDAATAYAVLALAECGG